MSAESTDLIRRLDSAISTKSLHPEYARGLLREARDALENPTPYTPYAGRAVPRIHFDLVSEETPDEPT